MRTGRLATRMRWDGLVNDWRPGRLGDWIDAADPGALRRYHATRTTLAMATAWLLLRLISPWIAGRPVPAAGFYAIIICACCALIVRDARPTERRQTLVLSMGVFVLALLLSSLLNLATWLYPPALLILIFGSYAARRWGLRPGELVLLLTMGLYFAENMAVSWSGLASFLFAVAAGVGSLLLWQVVLLPYDPVQSMRTCIRAFYTRAAQVAGEVGRVLEDERFEQEDAEADAWQQTLQRHLRQVKLSRSVIESQFPGALAPGAWAEEQLNGLQLAFFGAEQGLVQMVDSVTNRELVAEIPAEFRTQLSRSLRSLQLAMESGSLESMQALAQESADLRARVRSYVRTVLGPEADAAYVPPHPWALNALRLVGGSYTVAQSIGQVRALETGRAKLSHEPGSIPQAASPKPSAAGAPSPVPIAGTLRLHPATVLGIQAAVATGSAMIVAWLVQADHSNWVFWSAFVVIAGSTGESLRKMLWRVIGTVAGAVVGVALFVAVPHNAAFIVAFATLSIFLTIYMAPISYPQMVFWLNVGIVLVYTSLLGGALHLLWARPVTTLLGGLVAALVVVFILPIRSGDRFRVAAAGYFQAMDRYIALFVAALTGGLPSEASGTEEMNASVLEEAQAQLAGAYAGLEKTLPGIAFEHNPLVQAHSPLTERATQIAALHFELAHLDIDTTDQAALTEGAAAFVQRLQAQIHADIGVIIPLLTSAPQQNGRTNGPDGADHDDPVHRGVAELPAIQEEGLAGDNGTEADEQRRVRSRSGLALLRIRNMLGRLAADLGADARMQMPPPVEIAG